MSNFNEKCYSILKKVPKGKVTTYKALAEALKCKAYRAVGQAMNKNNQFPIVPCHRVINSNGDIGGYALGINKKIELLKEEGIEVINNKVDLNKFMHKL
jgi:methylated-DNA-[protein]-cysteine S-methyltransferase